MAYAFTQEVAFTPDIYQRFLAAMQDEPPKGLVVWVAEKAESGVRLLQVWDSREDYDAFVRDRVGPIVQDGFFASTGYRPPEEEPPKQPIEVLSVWQGYLPREDVHVWPGSGSVA